jgi:hypothetical protein
MSGLLCEPSIMVACASWTGGAREGTYVPITPEEQRDTGDTTPSCQIRCHPFLCHRAPHCPCSQAPEGGPSRDAQGMHRALRDAARHRAIKGYTTHQGRHSALRGGTVTPGIHQASGMHRALRGGTVTSGIHHASGRHRDLRDTPRIRDAPSPQGYTTHQGGTEPSGKHHASGIHHASGRHRAIRGCNVPSGEAARPPGM